MNFSKERMIVQYVLDEDGNRNGQFNYPGHRLDETIDYIQDGWHKSNIELFETRGKDLLPLAKRIKGTWYVEGKEYDPEKACYHI